MFYTNGRPRISSDFFPVVLTFLRQLPIIGNILNMPYIRTVSTVIPPDVESPIADSFRRALQALDKLVGARQQSIV